MALTLRRADGKEVEVLVDAESTLQYLAARFGSAAAAVGQKIELSLDVFWVCRIGRSFHASEVVAREACQKHSQARPHRFLIREAGRRCKAAPFDRLQKSDLNHPLCRKYITMFKAPSYSFGHCLQHSIHKRR
jgi:hypothetical protein